MKRFTLLLILLMGTIALLCSCDCQHKKRSEATCSAPSACLRCGEIFSDTLEHTAGNWIVDCEATCSEGGHEHQICSICGETIRSRNIPRYTHNYSYWITEKVATCTEDGSEYRTCLDCGKTDTKRLPKLGHTESDWIIVKNATCTEDGSQHQTCTVCNQVVNTEVLPKLGHIESDWIIDKNATCTEDGSMHKICSVCETTIQTETIAQVDHNCSTTIIKKATAENKAIVKSDCNQCDYSSTQEVDPITVSAWFTGSGVMMTSQVYYYRSFEATASGGYGDYLYKFESGSTLVQDFSKKNSVTIYGNMYSVGSGMEVKITVSDAAGQKTVYIIRGDGTCINTYPIYE